MLRIVVCLLFFLEQVFSVGSAATKMPALSFNQHPDGSLRKLISPDATFQVALVYVGYDSPREGYFCAGSLIDSRWVLTAAHCLSSHSQPSDLKIAVGSAKLSESKLVPVAQIVRHEAFDRNSMINDIALIKLADPVHNMQPIRLADPKTERQVLKSHSHATVSGWGSKAFLPKTISEDLLYVTVPVIDRHSCSRSYKGAVTESMICAGDKDVDSCAGDSGGGLVFAYRNQQYLEGIVSWGESCGELKKPGVYTRIPSYLNWIKAHIK